MEKALKTPELLAEILDVISKDATLRHRYVGCAEGELCVLGGLAKHAGIPLPDESLNKHAIHNPLLRSFALALCKRYGFDRQELSSLQMCNDSYYNTELSDRRRALKNKVIHFWKR